MRNCSERPPALLIHGAGGGAWEWAIWCGVLEAEGVRCRAPDLQPVAAGLRATGWADYLAQVEVHVQAMPEPPVLIGASLGGLLAWAAAARQRCAALVLVNPLPPAPEIQLCPPLAERPAVVPWQRLARLPATRRAMPEADEASVLYAQRNWRDESGAVLNAAAGGLQLPVPGLPMLVLASRDDEQIPLAASRALALRGAGDFIQLPGGHLAPLLGRCAADAALQAVAWLNARAGFTTD